MSVRRWVCSGALLGVAGILTAVATWRHWSPCRTADRAACVHLQDTTHGFPGWGAAAYQDPVGIVLVTIAAVVLAAAWVTALGWRRDGWPFRIMLVVIGLQPLIAAAIAASELRDAEHQLPVAVGGWLTWPAEMYIFPMLLGAGWLINEPAKKVLRLMLLGWAVTSFGAMHHFGDYVLARAVSNEATNSLRPIFSPPGMGYATAALQLTVGLILIATAAGRRRRGDGRPRRGDHTLAA